MAIRRRDYQFRCVWRRQGDNQDRCKVFDAAPAAYKFIIRMCGERPWQGCTRKSLRQVWAILAHRVHGQTVDALHYPTREAALLLQGGNAKILWLRIETRQIAQWTEMLDPMDVLKPKSWDNIAARAEAYCNELDAHPEKRWIPFAETEVK